MTDQQDDRRTKDNRQGGDRRIAQDPNYSGPERRKGDRRQHDRRSV
jgi:hypothetical protein